MTARPLPDAEQLVAALIEKMVLRPPSSKARGNHLSKTNHLHHSPESHRRLK